MTMSFWQLGWRTLWRDARAGELRLLWVAVTLAVAALTSVAFFANRLEAGLQRDARQLLGGDVVIASDDGQLQRFVDQAQALGLRHVTTLVFPTMGRATEARGGMAKLVALKAVDQGYPLRGRLQVADAAGAAGRVTAEIPAPGQAWVDAALLSALELQVGDTLLLGDASLRIAQVIKAEPDRGGGFMSFAPRVMIHAQDLAVTGLVQPASRITWRLAVAGEDAQTVARYAAWAQAQIGEGRRAGLRLESLDSGSPEMRRTLERGEKFLSLVALLAALLSAVAVALAARAFAQGHLDVAAMLRVLGLPQRRIAAAYALEFAVVGLLASLLGVALGWGVHHAFVWLLAGLVADGLPPPNLWPVGFGVGMGMTLLLAFGLPPVLQLAQVPPLRVLRRDVGAIKPLSAGVLGVGVLGFGALLMVVSRDPRLGGIAVGGFAAAALLFAALAWVAVWLLRRLVRENAAPRWLILATRQLAARPGYAVVQVSSLAVGLLALVLLVLLRTDLVSSWRQATPAHAPNRFVINIMPDQAQAFRSHLEQAGVQGYDWFPMIRGRLVEVNGQTVRPENYTDDRAQRMLDREFNLSNALAMPDKNTVTAGQWVAGEADGASVEDGIAQTLGLHLGDTLVFDIGGVRHSARLTSLRKVDWGSMRANFFIMFPVASVPDVPTTYMAAYRAPAQAGFDNALLRQFPNITNVDLDSTIAQVQRVLDQVIRAVEFLFAFTLAAGLVVLFAAVTATREERAREYAIMRALGAQSRLLRQVQRAELAGVGLLAGFLASCVAMLVGWALARWVFEFAWTAVWWVPLAGALAGAVLALGAGWWGLREVLQRPVMHSLRAAAE
ncbi:ABC transporter permease [Comamonas aquatica]|uniref:ABC transporter permease n=1 Tax=Comamonas aquatica TaxID=225991 RepID=UPI002448D7B8|nr:FtsX-like permease family protein [Comamonas aquatica]MDH0383114.1 ABC transporter permease [Comamonas aquatica]MDH0431099.1 ABC transporter permease [Comamonas aquatica]MDH0899446.1 ABC transporter permease [Comamonas aquatica]MDH0942126.1 ABC transporter permease [Comamonas aquatica]MDH1378931.1 ABC transporter permease [Comamonas aquatica]